MGTISDIIAERDHWMEAYEKASTELDQAVNCIYEVREALSHNYPSKAMEAVISYELNLDHKEK